MAGLNVLPEAFLGWHQIQESLSRLTGLEFALYNEEGMPIGLVSGESAFCRAIRRGGMDGTFCDEQCGRFIREAMKKDEVQYFKCQSGQRAFAIPLGKAGMRGLVIAGGKTFDSRADYEKSLELVKKAGGKVSLTGRHKYRYIGKRRLAEVVSLVKSASSVHFQTSFQKYDYQLKHNRQAALFEHTALLHHEKGREELVESLLRSITLLFEADTVSLHFVNLMEGGRDSHFVYGRLKEDVSAACASFGDRFRQSERGFREFYQTSEKADIEGLGLPPGEISSVISLPFYSAGEPAGAVCLFNSIIGTEDVPVLRAYVQQAASIIENRSLKVEVKTKIGELKKLVDVGAALGALRDPEEIYSFIFEKSAELLSAERGSLMLLNEKTDELMVKVARGLADDIKERLKLKPGEGIAGRVLAAGAPIMVEDIEKDDRLTHKKRPEYKTNSFISLPLRADGRVIGVINLADKLTGGVFSAADLDLVSGFASQASVALERAIFHSRAEELRMVSIRDPLTGLLNRRYFNDRLFEEIDRSKRYGHRFSLVIIDIDDFCSYNERHGRRAGDDALRRVSEVLVASHRRNDVLARYGDEEFTMILPETEPDKALFLTERIRKRVETTPVPCGAGHQPSALTVSIGLAGFPGDGTELTALFESAYRAMRRAKDLGKNRTETSHDR